MMVCVHVYVVQRACYFGLCRQASTMGKGQSTDFGDRKAHTKGRTLLSIASGSHCSFAQHTTNGTTTLNKFGCIQKRTH